MSPKSPRFWFSRSGEGPWLYIFNKLPGGTGAAGPFTTFGGRGLDVFCLLFSTNMYNETGPGSHSWNPLHCVFSLTLPSLCLPHLKADKSQEDCVTSATSLIICFLMGCHAACVCDLLTTPLLSHWLVQGMVNNYHLWNKCKNPITWKSRQLEKCNDQKITGNPRLRVTNKN